MNQYTANKPKVVIDFTKLQNFLNEKYIDMKDFLEETIDNVYEVSLSEKKNKFNIKRKSTKKQKTASKNNLPKNKKSQEKNIFPKNENSQENNNSEFPDTIISLNDNEENNKNNNSQPEKKFPNSLISESNVKEDASRGENKLSAHDEILEYCKEVLALRGIAHIETLDDLLLDSIELFKKEEQLDLIRDYLEEGIDEMTENDNVALLAKKAIDVFRAIDEDNFEILKDDQ